MPRPVLVLSFALVAAIAGLLGVLVGGGGTVAVPGGTLSAASASLSFADVVASVNPAVVHITAIQGEPRAGGTAASPRRGFSNVRRGEGTGFIVDSDGYILTNHHLVSSPERIRVRLADRREFPLRLRSCPPRPRGSCL